MRHHSQQPPQQQHHCSSLPPQSQLLLPAQSPSAPLQHTHMHHAVTQSRAHTRTRRCDKVDGSRGSAEHARRRHRQRAFTSYVTLHQSHVKHTQSTAQSAQLFSARNCCRSVSISPARDANTSRVISSASMSVDCTTATTSAMSAPGNGDTCAHTRNARSHAHNNTLQDGEQQRSPSPHLSRSIERLARPRGRLHVILLIEQARCEVALEQHRVERVGQLSIDHTHTVRSRAAHTDAQTAIARTHTHAPADCERQLHPSTVRWLQ
jgi:hypothetical protein